MPPTDNAYKLRNQEFLQEYAQKPGVKIMFNGVMYREITKGHGPKPSPKSFVTVYYTGKLINGKVFDQTQKGRPATFRLNELITGWITALREMPVGSRWEIVIPYNLCYGSRPAGAIKAFSTLIFDITLLDVR
jgi:FKBP-type peptidyl-prolyl cis-trans isomerase FklB